jgi:plasmid stabilization system protein ParE
VKVHFSPRAERRVETVDKWWRESSGTPTLFREELDAAIARLAEHPYLAPEHKTVRGRVIRRLVLKKTKQGVYYWVDERTETVRILTVWGTDRRPPKL